MPQNCRSGHRHPLPLFCPTLYWAIRTEMNQAGAAVTGEPPVRLRRADMPVGKTSPPTPTSDLWQEGAKKWHSSSQVPQFFCARNIV